jgi:hypothetical protein
MSEPPAGRPCVRCRQPLPKDVTYCVGCGCQNDANAVYSKQVGFDHQIENRQAWLKFMTYLWGRFRW